MRRLEPARRWSWLAAVGAVLCLHAPRAQAQDADLEDEPDTTRAVRSYVDMTGTLQAALYVDPVGVSAVVRGSETGARYGGALSLSLLRVGKQWGRASLAETRVYLLGGDQGFSSIVAVDSLDWDVQYQCRDRTDTYQFVPPLGDLVAPTRGCRDGEWLAYGFQLAHVRVRPESAHVALRLVEGTLALNAFATGRTERAYGEQLVFRIGASADYVGFGDVVRPTDAGNSDWAARGLVSARLVLSTTPIPIFRFALAAVWRPRFGVWEDQQVEGQLDLTLHLAASRDLVFALTARGAGTYASWPWTSTSEYADPASQWSVHGQLRLELYWGSS